MLISLLGVNWKTTLAGITALVAAFGRIALAWKTKDFAAILTDGQLMLATLLSVAIGLGLIKAKDQNVTGAGPNAAIVHSDGTRETK